MFFLMREENFLVPVLRKSSKNHDKHEVFYQNTDKIIFIARV